MSRFFLPSAACILLLLCVRVYTTYNPPANDPNKNQDEESVTGATVTVSSDSSVYEFQKIVLQRPDTSRYTSSIVAYSCYPFRPARGKTYRLSISSPTLGAATAVTTVAGTARISPINFFCLANPYDWYNQTLDYGMDIFFSGKPEGFVARIYVDYLASTPTGLQPKRRQVPIVMRSISKLSNSWELIFFPPIRRTSAVPHVTQSFSTMGWHDLLENIIGVEDGYGSRFVQDAFQEVMASPDSFPVPKRSLRERDHFVAEASPSNTTRRRVSLILLGDKYLVHRLVSC